MSRSQTQIILMLIYGLTGMLAFLAPSLASDILALPADDRSPSALYLVRVFGVSQTMIALLLFAFIVNPATSRRLLITLAVYEALIVAATLISLGPGSLARRAATVAISLSALLALINLWGAFFARDSNIDRAE